MKKIILGAVFFSVSLFSFAQQQRMTPELLWSLGRVNLEAVSPDNEFALYTVTNYDVAENKGKSTLFKVKIDGTDKKNPTQLSNTTSSINSATFRPDGNKIAYLQDGKMWEMNPDGSQAMQVSDMEIDGFAYSPAGDKLLFVQQVDYKKENPLFKDLPKAQGRLYDDLMYRHWSTWEDDKYSNIFVVDYADGKWTSVPTNIMNEPFDSPLTPFGGMEQITWAPDGKSIVYTCKKMSGKAYAVSTNADLYHYDLITKSTKNLTEGMDGYDMEPAFSPDGKFLAWNSMKKPGFEADRNRIFFYEFSSGERWEFTKGLDTDCNHPTWSADGESLYFLSGQKATYQLFTSPVRKGKIRQITSGFYNFNSFKLAGTNLVATRTSMSDPQEIYRVTTDAGKAIQITFATEPIMETVAKGLVKKRMVKTTDGKDMLVWVIYPPNFDPNKKYPTLLYCQGGPQSAVSQFWSYRWNFQLMAANDYIIVAPNRRGLPTFGTQWNEQISGDWGGQAQLDLLSAIDDVKKEPYVDKDRLGAVGASYGGYSVYWLAGHHEQRFKALISHCGLFNLESWYGTTEELFFANNDIGGPYWESSKKEGYEKNSPHNYVGNWDAPILVIHGEKDFRVPIGEGMQAFQAAQIKGIPSQFLYFPNEGHWVNNPQNGILWHRVFFNFLDQYLK